jgi:hypothetical protein
MSNPYLIHNLTFSHFVTDKNRTFVSARDASGHVYNYLVEGASGKVSEQVGGHFEELAGAVAELVRLRVWNSCGVPVYRISEIPLH